MKRKRNKKNFYDSRAKIIAMSIAATLSFASDLLAVNTCRCPVLHVEHLVELYESGRTYDSFRGYIPHSRRKITKKDRKNIAGATIKEAFKAANGACTCWYSVRDRNGQELDKLGLEELKPKRFVTRG